MAPPFMAKHISSSVSGYHGYPSFWVETLSFKNSTYQYLAAALHKEEMGGLRGFHHSLVDWWWWWWWTCGGRGGLLVTTATI